MSRSFLAVFAPAFLLAAFASAADGDDVLLPALEKVTVEAPPLEIVRPGEDWVFIDVAKQREIAARDRPSASVEDEFGALRARIWHASSRALLSVHAYPLTGPAPEAAELERHLRAEVARRPGAELVEIGRVQLPGGVEGVKADWVQKIDIPRAPGQRELAGGASDVYLYSRIDVPRPRSGFSLLFFFEVPKERWSKAKPGWLKLLRKLKIG